jgi:hypothetical protein
MAGWYCMHRGWMENPVFADEPFSRAQAWAWLIENAAWKDGVTVRRRGQPVVLERGQLSTSLRALADAWRWSKSKVDRFLADLETAHMLGQSAGHNGAVLTVQNYAKYQASDASCETLAETQVGTESGTRLGHGWDTKEQGKEHTQPRARTREGQGYAFEGKVIRLNQTDYDRWKRTYHGIPDLTAELTSIDAWLADQPEAKRKRWFQATTGMLNRAHQDRLSSPKPTSAPAPRSYGRQAEPDEFEAAMACGRASSERAASGGYGPRVFPSLLTMVN